MRRLYMYIDFFRKQPCTNDMGHMFGSFLFQSLEENVFCEVTDEITNVYTVGATAFALFENITAHATAALATSSLRSQQKLRVMTEPNGNSLSDSCERNWRLQFARILICLSKQLNLAEQINNQEDYKK